MAAVSEKVSGLVPMPVLSAGDVALRPFQEDDVPLVLGVGRDELIPLITTVPAGADSGQARAWIERQHQRLAAGPGYSFCIASSEALGQIGLWPHRPGPGPGEHRLLGRARAPRSRRRDPRVAGDQLVGP